MTQLSKQPRTRDPDLPLSHLGSPKLGRIQFKCHKRKQLKGSWPLPASLRKAGSCSDKKALILLVRSLLPTPPLHCQPSATEAKKCQYFLSQALCSQAWPSSKFQLPRQSWHSCGEGRVSEEAFTSLQKGQAQEEWPQDCPPPRSRR